MTAFQQFTIPFRLPSLNDYINANRRNRYAGAKLKKDTERDIGWAIKAANLRPVNEPCKVKMTFVEPNRRRDVDNVESSKKYVLDALVKMGILHNDSPKYVTAAPSYTEYGQPARVIVELIEA